LRNVNCYLLRSGISTIDQFQASTYMRLGHFRFLPLNHSLSIRVARGSLFQGSFQPLDRKFVSKQEATHVNSP